MVETTNQTKQEWDHPYIGFTEAFKMAEQIKKMGGVTSPKNLAAALGSKQGGWFGLQVASVRRWGLVDGRGELKLTDHFNRMKKPRAPGDDLKAKKEVFLNIPLFKSIYEKYTSHGLPQEPFFSNVLQSEYGLKGRNPSLVAGLVREFIVEHYPNYGKDESNQISDTTEESPTMLIGNGSESKPIKSEIKGSTIIIQTGFTEPFKWNITKKSDFNLIRSVIESIEGDWQQKFNANNNPEGDRENDS